MQYDGPGLKFLRTIDDNCTHPLYNQPPTILEGETNESVLCTKNHGMRIEWQNASRGIANM